MSGPVPEGQRAEAPAGAGAKAGRRPPESWLRENLEAVTVAVVMALLIRHFCVEAFRIPTSSMEPTLYGNRSRPGPPRSWLGTVWDDLRFVFSRGGVPSPSGDRILVNKFRYRFREPRRWDVVVFRYPLNRDKNYIKRIVGLPGEALDIAGGEIWANGRVARKPARVQDGVWHETWRLAEEAARAARGERFEEDLGSALDPLSPLHGDLLGTRRRPADPIRALGCRTESEAWRLEQGTLRADVRSERGVAWIELPTHSLVRRTLSGSPAPVARDDQGDEIGDVRLRARVRGATASGAPGALRIRIGPGERRFEVRLPIGDSDGGETVVTREGHGEGEAAVEVARARGSLAAGREVALEVSHADAAVEVRVDGAVVLRHEYEPPLARDFVVREGVPDLGAEGAVVEVASLDLARDLHYLRDGVLDGSGPLAIPAGHYVMCGDNGTHSKDSRLWRRIVLRKRDGTRVTGDGDTSARGDDGEPQLIRDEERGRIILVDDTGFRHTLRREDLLDSDGETTPAPFVAAENIVGEAFFVFWPLSRWRFVH
ncbi:MAG: signal peptidase I [Planctomycetales bacterium]|nr:signal peptidase I [Planctomycetales bacterium]